ncbi:cytochrome C [Pedobacter yulinensis]|uniref:Cytochrome C n=2 Tax=Pedobacter yulinensis TaxID=2126353 RepID=A0A2T3HMU9_9SPHI|nr:cytochrome C [Pedobacter yulinensis]
MLHHAYDEIYELDNPVPRWFNVLFYGTIVIGAIYMAYNHLGPGLRQDDEYQAEMAEAQAAKLRYLATAANAIDENSVKADAAPATLASGRTIFAENCAVCHGDKGQGMIGPNLTDAYWLHGGDIGHIFKTIKYGVPEKGMVSWEKTLSAKQIAEVSNFILSLKGTDPAGAKDPQGEQHEESGARAPAK